MGARIGAAAVSELGPVDVHLSIAETFGPAPVVTELDLGAELALEFMDIAGNHPGVPLGWASQWRHWGRKLEDDIKVKGTGSVGVFRVGVGLVY